jgi:hypothetical protein
LDSAQKISVCFSPSQAVSARTCHTSADDPPALPGVVDIPAVIVHRSVDTYKIERVMAGNSHNFICIAAPFFITDHRARIFKCLWGPGIDSKE